MSSHPETAPPHPRRSDPVPASPAASQRSLARTLRTPLSSTARWRPESLPLPPRSCDKRFRRELVSAEDHSPHRRGSPPRSSEAESLLPRCSEPVAHGSVPAGRQALPCPGCFRDGDRAPARPCESIALPPTPSLRRRATRERALGQGGPTNGSSLPWRPARVPRNPRASPSRPHPNDATSCVA